MAEPTKLEILTEDRNYMYEGMCKVGESRDIWQNNLIWWICKTLHDLCDDRIKELRKNG